MTQFGFDPELFVVRKGSRMASSVHLMGVDDDFESVKANDDGRGDAVKMEPSGRGEIFMKTDGFAVELNSRQGNSCRDFFIPYTAAVLRQFYREYGNEWRLSAVPVMELNSRSVKGDVPFGVNEFGCLPDMDAYTLAEKTPPRDSYHNNVRYIGGHLHKKLDYNFKTRYEEPERIMRAGAMALKYDLILGVPLVAMLGDSNNHGEATRRTYYGQAGSFRVKDYGMEYRVPSSAIIMSPLLLAWVLGVMKRTPSYTLESIDIVKDNVKAMNDSYDFGRMRHIINEHDVNEARKFVYEHREAALPYLPEFYDLMVNADLAQEPLNTNLFEAWALDEPILNHGYMGVQKLVDARAQFARTVFPVKVEEPLRKVGW